jgi:SAM-dependent methyltransferase
MRALVGPTEVEAFENSSGDPVFPDCDTTGAVFDFGCGCGCGRIARQLIQQHTQPERYVGIDLHKGMIEWCSRNLAPAAPQFRFHHHDVFNAGFNPHAPSAFAEFPVSDAEFHLVLAHSVFTHITESAATQYLSECRRVLRPNGRLRATWFLFDKRYFPMMQSFQNALYINEHDVTNAVIFDKTWLTLAFEEAGFVMTAVQPPTVRGYHWTITAQPRLGPGRHFELPEDSAPFGRVPPPVLTVPAYEVGS